jgi:isopentenyl phosphate kinase
MSEHTILKIGGSVLTDKSGDCAIDRSRIASIARDIAGARPESLLLIHGAGSCGHPQAQRYHLDRGLVPECLQGVYKTHAAVCRLNQELVQALRRESVEAIGIHPLGSAIAENGRMVSFDSPPLALMCERGLVPVLHGDVVMDRMRGASIVSGDQLVAYLAAALGVSRVGLATDVAGVLQQSQVIPRLPFQKAGSFKPGRSQHTDVTGGMEGKVAELQRLAEHGIESHIFHASRIRDFLTGSDHGGTVVEAQR